MNFTHLTNKLVKYRNDKIVFVGLGNDARGDDAAGLLFSNMLKTKSAFKNSKFIIAGKSPENYLQEILAYNPETVVFVDAANWGGNPGEISILDADTIANIDISTHTFSIKMVEEFLSLNNKIDFYYIGIQPENIELGKKMSLQVSQAINNFFI